MLPEQLSFSRFLNRPGDTRARPLRVRLSSVEDVCRVLGHLSSLPDGIMATSDKTFGQRAEIRKLRQRMQQHNAANPQQQVTIRSVNNVPLLVDTSEPRSRKAPGGFAASSLRFSRAPPATSASRSNSHRGSFTLRQPVLDPAGGAISRNTVPTCSPNTVESQVPPNATQTGKSSAQPVIAQENTGSMAQQGAIALSEDIPKDQC